MAIEHTIRADNGKTQTLKLTPLTAVKKLCIECMGFQKHEVKHCTSPMCPVYPFRMGKGHTGRKGNAENLG